ncbi:uncharacterized protein BO96DRAFT_431996 [Aspergillus niger CBS 101883]|uniref:Uncharacterized protein n=2 Tax=Aspergillus niger TaxID=5061 RepID=A2QR74_ASPNC|nr:uncharacterized protein BO96DRAFT_431996 [Aspergillus niger CBS 101883]XP_059604016.1 hypothetical protein An08g05020 [Aspergillus niger]PYH58900.1 hypothetical protein BO96DRAFT_431996 [Aspergillus niger CBS 101883]CAK45475.1 hypothetical protein An08g05020 [Aspergillus niger]
MGQTAREGRNSEPKFGWKCIRGLGHPIQCRELEMVRVKFVAKLFLIKYYVVDTCPPSSMLNAQVADVSERWIGGMTVRQKNNISIVLPWQACKVQGVYPWPGIQGSDAVAKKIYLKAMTMIAWCRMNFKDDDKSEYYLRGKSRPLDGLHPRHGISMVLGKRSGYYSVSSCEAKKERSWSRATRLLSRLAPVAKFWWLITVSDPALTPGKYSGGAGVKLVVGGAQFLVILGMTNVNRFCKRVKSDGHHDPLTGIGLDFWDGPTTRGVTVCFHQHQPAWNWKRPKGWVPVPETGGMRLDPE